MNNSIDRILSKLIYNLYENKKVTNAISALSHDAYATSTEER